MSHHKFNQAAATAVSVDGSTPVFSEPWQARAFAMTLRLHERGLFTWQEWTQTLATQIGADGHESDAGYYAHWLNALESLLATKQLTRRDELTRVGDAWGRAAARTPHGQPVELSDADFHTGP